MAAKKKTATAAPSRPAKRRYPKGTSLAGQIVLCGHTIDILLVDDLRDGEVECNGLYDTLTATISIDSALSENLLRTVLVHEILHAMLDLSGAMHELCSDLAPNVDGDRVEERLVRTLTPHIVAILNSDQLRSLAKGGRK
jgi:hypothetical protein